MFISDNYLEFSGQNYFKNNFVADKISDTPASLIANNQHLLSVMTAAKARIMKERNKVELEKSLTPESTCS